MHPAKKIIPIYLSALFLTFAGSDGTIQAKSLYAITRHLENKLSAYYIQADQIVGPNTIAHNLAGHGSGPVGLALDPDSEKLFITYELSNIIEIVNAKTMISEENPVIVPEVDNCLAGIAFDKAKQKLCKMGFIFLYLKTIF